MARQHRNNPTVAERRLWQLLRRRRLDGYLFRRQFPVGPYFADLYCPAARLAIEIDGPSHLARRRADRLRDAFFGRQNIRVLRLSDKLVLEKPTVVLELIRLALPPAPSRSEGAGGRNRGASASVWRAVPT
ncbi:MAG: DUF559 domain-containing protein [Polyangiaceae bacterium]|nr:DUF559 domain-containing protein [Polyangiaceae bacterium]